MPIQKSKTSSKSFPIPAIPYEKDETPVIDKGISKENEKDMF
jgi:hypothetical protein